MNTKPTQQTSQTMPRHDRSRLRAMLLDYAPVLSIALFFLLVCLFFALTADAFVSERNLLNLLRQSAPILIAAVAMTFVITTGGIDLSVGSTLALVNALAALALAEGLPWPLVVVLMLLVGALLGLINGYFIAYEGIPAFIVTLATLSAVRGLALLLTQGYSIPIAADSGFVELGRGWVLGIPLPALVAIILALVGFIALRATRFGRYVTGIGANKEAVRRSGVNVRRYEMSVYVL